MLLTTKQMAAELQVSVLTVKKMAAKNSIPGFRSLKVGRQWRFEKLDAVKTALQGKEKKVMYDASFFPVPPHFDL